MVISSSPAAWRPSSICGMSGRGPWPMCMKRMAGGRAMRRPWHLSHRCTASHQCACERARVKPNLAWAIRTSGVLRHPVIRPVPFQRNLVYGETRGKRRKRERQRQSPRIGCEPMHPSGPHRASRSGVFLAGDIAIQPLAVGTHSSHGGRRRNPARVPHQRRPCPEGRKRRWGPRESCAWWCGQR